MLVFVLPPGATVVGGQTGSTTGGSGGSTGSLTAGLRVGITLGAGNMPAAMIPNSTTGTNATPSTLASILAASNPGDVILLASGTYTNQQITPKNGQWIGGAPGATVVLDGTFSTFSAFTGSATNVTIANLAVQHYTCGVPSGWRLAPGYAGTPSGGGTVPGAAIDPNWQGTPNGPGGHPHSPTPANGWNLLWVDTDYNRTAGFKVVDGMTIRNVRTRNNGVEGFIGNCKGATIDNLLTQGNNTPDSFAVTGNTASDQGNEAGGGKLTGDVNNIVTHVETCFNQGNALWDDAYCGVAYSYVYAHDNCRNGIMHEIGFDATITNSQLDRCGQAFTTPITSSTVAGISGGSSYDQGAGIYWSDSRGTSPSTSYVQSNIGTGNNNWIVCVQANRYPYLSNVAVGGTSNLGNHFTSSGKGGWYAPNTTQPVSGLTFNGDALTTCGQFMWAGGLYTFAQLQQAFQQELAGSFS